MVACTRKKYLDSGYILKEESTGFGEVDQLPKSIQKCKLFIMYAFLKRKRDTIKYYTKTRDIYKLELSWIKLDIKSL